MIEENLEKRLKYFDRDENLYTLLGLNHKEDNISFDDIKQAKRIQSKLYHPDKNKNDPNAQSKFVKISRRKFKGCDS